MIARVQRIVYRITLAAVLLLFAWILARSGRYAYLSGVAVFGGVLVAHRLRPFPQRVSMGADRASSMFAAAMRPLPVMVLAAVALAVRLLWSQHFDPRIVSDYREFHDLALRFAAGEGSVLAGSKSPMTVAFYGILYELPVRPLVVAQVANAVLGTVQVVLIYAIARRAFASRAAGRLAGLGAALFPSAVMFTSLPASEHLFLTLLLLVVWQLLTYVGPAARADTRRVAAVAAVIGVEAALLHLTRNSGLLFALWATAVFLLWARAGAKRVALFAGVFAAAALVCLSPQVVHNYRTYGSLSIQSSRYAGLNLLCGTNRQSAGRYNALDVNFIRARYGMGDEKWNEAMAAARQRAFRRIAEDIPGFFAFALKEKFDLMWCDDTYGAMTHPVCLWHNRPVPWRAISEEFYFAMIALASAGLCLSAVRRRGASAVVMTGGILVLTLLMHLFIEVQPRYHALMGCFLPLYAGGLLAARGDDDE